MTELKQFDKSRQHATPRTDRFDPRCGRDEGKDDALTSWLGIVTISGPDYERLLDHARQLERELAERTDSLVETAAHASKLMDERDSMKVAQSSTAATTKCLNCGGTGQVAEHTDGHTRTTSCPACQPAPTVAPSPQGAVKDV